MSLEVNNPAGQGRLGRSASRTSSNVTWKHTVIDPDGSELIADNYSDWRQTVHEVKGQVQGKATQPVKVRRQYRKQKQPTQATCWPTAYIAFDKTEVQRRDLQIPKDNLY